MRPVRIQNLNDIDSAGLAPGDSLALSEGIYNQPLQLVGVRGTQDRPILISGEDNAIIDVRMRHYAGIELTDCRFLVLRGFVVRNSDYAGLVLHHSSFCQVEQCRFENCRRSPVVVWGYSIDPPIHPASPWQWYRQLPLAVGNTFRDLEWESPRRGPDLHLAYAFLNRFINCGVRTARLAHSCGNVIVQDETCDLDEVDLSANNEVGRDVPSATCSLRELELEQPGQDNFRNVAKKGLAALTGFRFECSEKRLERLVTQSLYLLIARVDADGQCAIAPPPDLYDALQFRDDPNIAHQFDKVVHGRDALIAAECMMSYGATECGERIVHFMTQSGVSAVGWGAAKGDTMIRETQIDIPCHLVRALHTHWRLTHTADLFETLLDALSNEFRAWDDSFDARFKLYSTGASEQLALAIPVLGLFENCFLMDGLGKLAELAEAQGGHTVRDWALERSGELRHGIEKHLKPGGYCAGVGIQGDGTKAIVPVGCGPELVALRAFPDCDRHALETTYLAIMEHIVPWGDFLFPVTRFVDQRGMFLTMGKDFGSLMAHQARTGRLSALSESLRFILEITTRPAYVVPDHWEYFRNRDLDTVWRGYAQNPRGQYTMGVANCEQVAEWLLFFRNAVLGIRDTGERLLMAPALPFEITSFAVSGMPTPWGDVGYRLSRGDHAVELDVSREETIHEIDICLPVPKQAKNIRVDSGEKLEHTERSEGEAVFVSYRLLPGVKLSRICWSDAAS